MLYLGEQVQKSSVFMTVICVILLQFYPIPPSLNFLVLPIYYFLEIPFDLLGVLFVFAHALLVPFGPRCCKIIVLG
jgi:hypothetical protein